jgi:hypothetical protein
MDAGEDSVVDETSVADKTNGVDTGNRGKRQKRQQVGNDLATTGGCDGTGKRQKRRMEQVRARDHH